MSRYASDLFLIAFYSFSSIAIAAAIVTATYYLKAWRCEQRWSDSTYESRYKAFVGCQVNVDGVWLPDDLIREIVQ